MAVVVEKESCYFVMCTDMLHQRTRSLLRVLIRIVSVIKVNIYVYFIFDIKACAF